MIEKELRKGMQAAWLPENTSGTQKNVAIACLTTNGTKFKYLPFVMGEITSTFSQGQDVLSGPFSGCIMAAYTGKEGGRKVCHVATDKESSLDKKEAWSEIKQRSDVEAEIKPYDKSFAGTVGKAYSQNSSRDDRSLGFTTYGLITADGKCYSIMAYTKTRKVFLVGNHTERQDENLS